jgi:hypothetical protein
MPRVSLAAGAWLAVAAASAGLCLPPAQAAPPASARRAAPERGENDGHRRDEVDLLQRQDAAEALKKHFNIEVDWRVTPLERLIDIRARAAKAAELQLRLGVTVDWQRYSWIELEALRRTLISFERYRDQHATPGARSPAASRETLPAPAEDALVSPTFKDQPAARASQGSDPDGIIRPTFTGRWTAPIVGDPDGVIRPTFLVRPRWSSFVADPDGLIAPTFVPVRRLSLGGADDLQDRWTDGLMDPTRTQDARPTPARW